MTDTIRRLQMLVNQEIVNKGYTIKAFAVTCEVSYEEMRKICNGQIVDIRMSTLEKICSQSDFDIQEIISKDGESILKHNIRMMMDGDVYSVSFKKMG